MLSAASALDGLSLADGKCAVEVLRREPFTDYSLPTRGGNVPKSPVPFIPGAYYPRFVFAADYERPLPPIGNALRRSINAAEAEMKFAANAGVEDSFQRGFLDERPGTAARWKLVQV